jgi:hypothetical protein
LRFQLGLALCLYFRLTLGPAFRSLLDGEFRGCLLDRCLLGPTLGRLGGCRASCCTLLSFSLLSGFLLSLGLLGGELCLALGLGLLGPGLFGCRAALCRETLSFLLLRQ